jgi:succinoglycan biosynthesis protein ExoA
MSDRPFVTLVMPSYNEENYIEECLNSLLRQDYPADRVEILVADGGSRDRTREIIERVALANPRVRMLDNSEH